MIVIVNYNMGNVGSVYNMIKKIGFESLITSNINEIEKAKKIILPGVGAFDNGIINLKKLGLIEILEYKVFKERVPILGICLGMQLMTKKSEEGELQGLSWIDAETKRFVSDTYKIPHMGWNYVKIIKNSDLFSSEFSEWRFYFVHSYYVECYNKDDILTTTFYIHDFVSSFQRENIIGVQFHPEKSHKFGMMLLKNFITKF
jgi:glutamine amidotransferase